MKVRLEELETQGLEMFGEAGVVDAELKPWVMLWTEGKFGRLTLRGAAVVTPLAVASSLLVSPLMPLSYSSPPPASASAPPEAAASDLSSKVSPHHPFSVSPLSTSFLSPLSLLPPLCSRCLPHS